MFSKLKNFIDDCLWRYHFHKDLQKMKTRHCYIHPLHKSGEVVAMFGAPEFYFGSVWYAVKPDGEDEVYLFGPATVKFDDEAEHERTFYNMQDYLLAIERGVPLLPTPSAISIKDSVYSTGDDRTHLPVPTAEQAHLNYAYEKLGFHIYSLPAGVSAIKVKDWIAFLAKNNATLKGEGKC